MSEAYAARFLREVRWSGGVRCVYCGSLYVICWGWYRGVYRRYRCKRCLRTFKDKSGTDFKYSRMPLNERLFIAYLSVPLPLLASTVELSTETIPCSLRDANALNILSHIPISCHFLSLLQAVLYDPYLHHLQPVVRTYSIPLRPSYHQP
jgi:transposase-like protein